MKKSVFFKIFAGYLLITLVLTTLIVLLSFRTIRNHHIDTLTNDLKNLGTAIELKVAPLLEENRFEELDTLVKSIGKQVGTRITITTSEGIVLADSERNPEMMEKHRTRPEIIQALKGKVGRSIRFSTTVREDMLYVALPLKKNGQISAVLRVSLFLKDINKLLDSLRMNLVYTAIIVLVISLLGAVVFSRNLSKPIRKLSAASRRVASGDFNAKVLLKRQDELGELADSFNCMTNEIKTLFTELARQKEELNSIISSLHEGLVVLDKKEQIVLSNESFRRIVQNELVDGRCYWELVREPKFGELINKTMHEKRDFVEEVELRGKTFLCSTTFLESREGIVVIFHDITEMKTLDKMKRDFVVNVSHELRTPLTAIKGFTETLEEEGEGNKRYLDIIKRHTDRLVNIVDDLLSLSELEERGVNLEVEEVDLKELAENILRIFEVKLKEKNLDVTLTVDDGLLPIKADPYRLEQMLINLIDNAIKYTERGEIAVRLGQGQETLVIEIQDTGIGIPEAHLPRILERFYVVDKARSKTLGGTGLGLSIVKHIVLLHGGKIDVESTPGVGTTFVITLPSNPL